MRIIMQALFWLLLMGCAKPNKPQPPPPLPKPLIEKYQTYLSLGVNITDKWGWLRPKCDGLGFNSLAAYAGFPVDPMRGEKAEGLWERHPEFDCFQTGQSKSTISRDMFRMLFIYLYDKKNIDALKRIEDYGKSHGWVMGEGDWSRVMMSPLMSYQLSRMIRGGPSFDTDGEYVGLKNGYEGHLHALEIFLDSLIDQGISDGDLKTLGGYAAKEKNNALYQAFYYKFSGNKEAFDRVIAILSNENIFPNDRLPNEKTEHFTHYLWERDEILYDDLFADDNGCIHYYHESSKDLTHECGLTPKGQYLRSFYNTDFLPCIEQESVENPLHVCKGQSPHAPTDFIFALKVLGQ